MSSSLNQSLTATILAVSTFAASAAQFSEHVGANDPGTEGFTKFTFLSGSTVGPVLNDQGHAAWSITNSTLSSQAGYISGTFSDAEKAGIASSGFSLSFEARAQLNSATATYDNVNHIVLAGAHVSYGTKHFEIGLGQNASGDTVVVLPTSVDNSGPGLTVRAFGPSYTLTGLGSGYHQYGLVLDPTTQLAELSIDGVTRISNYAGNTTFIRDSGLAFDAYGGGTGYFSHVFLAPVPEPTSSVLLLAGLLGLGVFGHRKKSGQ